MPWTPKDSARHTKKAKAPVARRQWAEVADSVLAKTNNEGRAVREANAVVKRRTSQRKPGTESESHTYNWRSRENLKRAKEIS